ncbi:MAG: hypothetical protein RIS85_2249 [Pseudomonadota bacterium]
MTQIGFRTAWFALLACCALLAGGALPARASEDRAPLVYAGKVGKADVVLKLERFDDGVIGRYFYTRHRLDIPLEGDWRGDNLALTSDATGDRLNLRVKGNALTGTLITAKGKSVATGLQRVDFAAPVDPHIAALLPQLSPYDQLQLAGLSLIPGEVSQRDGRTVRNYREPVSGISLFRIESGYPAEALRRLNTMLERQHLREVSVWFGCPGFDGAPGMDISEAGTPWLSENYVSYDWTSSWTCAGTAHPDFGSEGHTYDVRTGREIALDEILHFGSTAPPAEGDDKFYTYRGEVFAPAVVALLRKLYPEEFPARTAGEQVADDECDYGDAEVWAFPSWYLDGDGLHLGAVFPRVMRACDTPEWSIIPWDHLPKPLP